MKQIDDKDIPNVSVTCPALGSLVSVRDTCTECKFIRAVAQTNPDRRLPWTQAHQLVCGYPRRLPMQEHVAPEDAKAAIERKTLSRYD